MTGRPGEPEQVAVVRVVVRVLVGDEDVPEVQQTLRVLHAPFPTTIANKDAQKSVLVNDCRWTEPQLADVFSIDLVQGDTANLFRQQNSLNTIAPGGSSWCEEMLQFLWAQICDSYRG